MAAKSGHFEGLATLQVVLEGQRNAPGERERYDLSPQYRLCYLSFLPHLEGLLLLPKNKKKSENSASCGQIFRFATLQVIARLDTFTSNALYLSRGGEASDAVYDSLEI